MTDWVRQMPEGDFDPFRSPPRPMPPIIWQILLSKGITHPDDIEELFAAPLQKMLDPFTIKDMDLAVSRLVEAYREGQKICIYADFDMDGTPGLALFYNGLIGLGFDAKNIVRYQPSRLEEGYGLHPSALDFIKSQQVDLVMTIDLGITAVEASEYCKQLGMDLIITDHHLPGETLPEALAIVNPNRRDCSSGLEYLAGTGVAFYVLVALKGALKEASEAARKFNLRSVLDLFCIGTLADMVPLEGDNRRLVKHGLVELAKTSNPGLKALMKNLGIYGKELTSSDVAIRLVPKINALSRLECGPKPIDVLLLKDNQVAENMVSEVLDVHKERQHLQKKAEEKALIQHLDRDENLFVWEWSENFHKGVIGLVATQLMQKFNCPAFIGKQVGDVIVVSARTPKESGIVLVELLSKAQQYLLKFGGHSQAAGFELEVSAADEFRQFLKQELSMSFKLENPKIEYCAEAGLQDINAEFMNWYSQLNPFGTGFETPIIRLLAAEVDKIRELKGGHLKISFANPLSHKPFEAVWFFPPADTSLVKELKPGQKIDLLVEPQWNEFAGRRSIQGLIKDVRPS